MKYDITIMRVVVNPNITSDIHTRHEFREADTNFTVLMQQIPDPNKKLVEFDPEAFMNEEDKSDAG